MKKKLIFLSRWFPYPADNGARIRIYNLLRQLSGLFEITLVTFCDPAQGTAGDIQVLTKLCKEVYTVPTPVFAMRGMKAWMGYFSPLPRWIIASDSQEMRKILGGLKEQNFDLCIASQVDMARYALPFKTCPVLLDELEISVITQKPLKETSLIRKIRSGLTAQKHTQYLTSLSNQFARVTTVSEIEKTEIQRVLPAYRTVDVIPNGVDVEYNSGDFGDPNPGTLIYSGALSYFANLDAVRYFLAEIYGLILGEQPNTIFQVTGNTQPEQLGQLPLERYQRNSVRFSGYVADIRPLIAQSWVSIVPLRIGGGTRLKILEAMALGTPVVSTPKGAEGLDLIPGKHYLRAETPQEFSQAVLSVLSQPTLRADLSEQARSIVAARYNWTAIGTQFIKLLDPLLEKPD